MLSPTESEHAKSPLVSMSVQLFVSGFRKKITVVLLIVLPCQSAFSPYCFFKWSIVAVNSPHNTVFCSVIIGAQMVLAVAPGVELVASAVVASETDINSLIVQIHCDGLRFSETAKQQPQSHQSQQQQQLQQQQLLLAQFRTRNKQQKHQNKTNQINKIIHIKIKTTKTNTI